MLRRCKSCASLLAASRVGLEAHKLNCRATPKAKAYFFAPMDYFAKKDLVKVVEKYLRPYFVG